MPNINNYKLCEKAEAAISKVFYDTSVDLSETKDNLKNISEHIEARIEAVKAYMDMA